MIRSLFTRSDTLAHPISSKDDNSLWSRLGLKTVLVFCSSRAWRGGPRLLLQIVTFLLALFVLIHMLPDELAGSGFANSYKNLLPWGTSYESEAAGDLRIVAFGSPDLVGSAADGARRRTTWTEQLCKELNCSSHLSFVPTTGSGHGLASNDIYAEEFQKFQNITATANITDKPASDFQFIAEQYPVPTEIPDLAAQVKQFLSLPPPKVPPRETLWIFTFGTWEIWNLAAMPKKSGEAVIDASIKHIFEQIEVLYGAALEPTSIAFSDFWSNVTEAQVDVLTAADAPEKVDHRKLESFRVLIPQLFDISLTPGWQSRSLPTFPNTLAEQTRNAAALTTYWNSEVVSQIDGWKKKGSTKPENIQDQPDHLVEVSDSNTFLKYISSKLLPALHPAEESEADPIIYAPYPLRNAWRSHPANRILDAMTEEEMQRGGVWDSKGRGKVSINDSMRFLDVWTPCYVASKGKGGDEKKECETPDNHLFLDPFTVGQRAITGLVNLTVDEVMDHLFMPSRENPGSLYRRGSEQSFIRKVRA